MKVGKLRVGWRVLFFVLLWSYCQRGLFAAAAPLFSYIHGDFPQYPLLIWLLSFLAVVAPTMVMALVEHRPMGTYGLPARQAFGVLFWKGALWGLAAITGLVLALRCAGVFYFGPIVLHGTKLARYAAACALIWLLVALFEQFGWLGYLRYSLTGGIGFWPTVTLLTAVYGGIHVVVGGGGFHWINGLVTLLLELFAALTLRRTGSLWFAVGVHSAFNWTITFLYSVPDGGKSPPGHLLSSELNGPTWLTGGSVGPEGGVFGFVMLAMLFAAFLWRYPEVRCPQQVGP